MTKAEVPCCHESPHVEAIGSLMRLFHSVSKKLFGKSEWATLWVSYESAKRGAKRPYRRFVLPKRAMQGRPAILQTVSKKTARKLASSGRVSLKPSLRKRRSSRKHSLVGHLIVAATATLSRMAAMMPMLSTYSCSWTTTTTGGSSLQVPWALEEEFAFSSV